MPGYVFKRVMVAVIAFFVISLFVYSIAPRHSLSSEFFEAQLSMGIISQEHLDQMKQVSTFDTPPPVLYLQWIGDIFSGDWGNSILGASYYK